MTYLKKIKKVVIFVLKGGNIYVRCTIKIQTA